MIVWKIGGKIIRTVLCCVVYDTGTHTCEQFLKMIVGLGLGLVFVHLFRFGILCFCVFSLDYFVLVLFAFVVLGLVFQYYAKRLAMKNISEMTYLVSSVS